MSEGHGERAARFRALYDAVYPRLTAYALRRARTREDAFDVVAETLLTAWRRLDEIPEGGRRLPWVFGVARRVLANHYRAEGRRERLAARARHDPPGAPEEFDLVHEALDALRPDQREILTLAAWEGLGNDDLAVALGITPGAAAVRLHRARRRLARELGRLGFTPGGANSVQRAGPSRTLQGVKGSSTGSGEAVRE